MGLTPRADSTPRALLTSTPKFPPAASLHPPEGLSAAALIHKIPEEGSVLEGRLGMEKSAWEGSSLLQLGSKSELGKSF